MCLQPGLHPTWVGVANRVFHSKGISPIQENYDGWTPTFKAAWGTQGDTRRPPQQPWGFYTGPPEAVLTLGSSRGARTANHEECLKEEGAPRQPRGFCTAPQGISNDADSPAAPSLPGRSFGRHWIQGEILKDTGPPTAPGLPGNSSALGCATQLWKDPKQLHVLQVHSSSQETGRAKLVLTSRRCTAATGKLASSLASWTHPKSANLDPKP